MADATMAGVKAVVNSGKKTAQQKRLEAWEKRLAANNGVMPGGRQGASWLSILAFSWIGPLVQLAYAKPLEAQHLYSLPSKSNSDFLLGRFEAAWGEQLAKPKGKRSLGKALFKMFRPVLILTGVLQAVQQITMLIIPLIVQQILQWLTDDDAELYVGVILAACLFVVGFFGNGLLTNHMFLMLYVLGMDARSTLNGVTYAKALRLSNRARQGTSTGEAVTLMSNDAQRLPDAALTVHSLWSTPIFLVAAIALLVMLVGMAAIAGIVFLVCMIPFQGYLAAKQMGLQRAQMKQTESRVRVINEVLQGIRIVKYYAWEAPFMTRIGTLRDQELLKIKQFAYINAYSMSIMLTTPFVMVMLTLITYFNKSGQFQPDVVFTAVSLLLVIRFPLMMLPMAIGSWVQGKVSLARLQAFFELEELQEEDRHWSNKNGNGKGAGSITASGTFVWTSSMEDDQAADKKEGSGKAGKAKKGKKPKESVKPSSVADAVKNGQSDGKGAEAGGEGISTNEPAEVEKWELALENLKIPTGKLVAVVGQVGSGKSSLVSALLGEMTKVDGEISVDGSIAYVAQTAWIINASLKENILMGRMLDEARYKKVLEVCDMSQDLAALPAGDATEIGEKGINLSGGQKQRVSIARAVYADADIYILDDPLSAVDAHVGRHLFDHCLTGFLKGKTIVLCANQLQFLSQTDLVLVVHQGRIVEEGTYPELMATEGGGLAKLMETLVDESDEETSDNEESKEESKDDGHAHATFGGVTDISITGSGARSDYFSRGRPPSSRSDGGPISARSTSKDVGRVVPGPAFGGRPPRSSKDSQKRPSFLDDQISDSSAIEDTWRRHVREASDMTTAMVEGCIGGMSPAPDAVTTMPDAEILERLHAAWDEDDSAHEAPDSVAGAAESTVNPHGIASRRRRSRSRTGSARRETSHSHGNGGRRSSAEHGDAIPLKKSASAVAEENANAAGTLGTVETQEEGAVAWKVFVVYFRDGSGGWGLPVLLLIVSVLTQGCSNAFDYWLSYWSDAYLNAYETEEVIGNWYQYVYAVLCVLTVLLYLARALLFAIQAVWSSRHLHDALSKGVMRAPVSFFDTTPIGRVLNRFTKDMDSVDLLLPRNVPQFVATLSVLIGVMITITAVLPVFIVAIVPIMYTYYKVQLYYRPINRDLQRLESVSRSPIFAQFSETLNGVSTLRAYNQQGEFISRNNERLDDSACAFYHMHVSNRWLGVRLEAMGNVMNLAAALLIVFGKDSSLITIQAGVAGLVLTYTQQITGYLNWTVRMGCETEARITAVERAQEYADLNPEAASIVEDYRPPKNWPETGAITFKGVEMRYRPGLDLVLKGVTLDIKGGERIGIAGRTGSGKSSLMVALFRIVEPCGGGITIDGVDALRLGLQDLREAISIIPQDPVMFCGTMRDNLDPFGRSDDPTIWAALEAARLSQYVSGLEGKLDAEVSEGGENMSLGQRQLLCLARAVLRRNKILVMDEATANVDMDTDALIQEAIREQFSGCTVLTIAHRLNTIMDMDRILVMQDGKVGEFDTPANLVANPDSLLMWFIGQTGAGSSKRLVTIANAGLDNSNLSGTIPPSFPGSDDSDPGNLVVDSGKLAATTITNGNSRYINSPPTDTTLSTPSVSWRGVERYPSVSNGSRDEEGGRVEGVPGLTVGAGVGGGLEMPTRGSGSPKPTE